VIVSGGSTYLIQFKFWWSSNNLKIFNKFKEKRLMPNLFNLESKEAQSPNESNLNKKRLIAQTLF
jgi:hypothetical protein